MSQVAAERLSEKRAGEAAKDTQDNTQSDNDSGHESDGDDEALGVGASVTEIAKTSKGVKGKKERPPPAEGVYFTAAGAVHSLMKRSTVFWLNSLGAFDFCDPLSHPERLRCALAAVQGFNLGGLRTIAPSLFVEEYMRANMLNASSTADKVKTIYMHAAT